MQKTKSKSEARRASDNSGKAGKAGKARKQLTPEQRERKRLADKARRRRIKLAKQARQSTQSKRDHSCCSKGCTCCRDGGHGKNGKNGKNGKAEGSSSRGQAGSPVTAVDVAVLVGKHVAMQVADAMPGGEVVRISELQDVEPGVSRGEVLFRNGSRAVVTFVDGNAVDPLSRFSPLPPQVKEMLFRHRMAQEISDLVDAHAGMESMP